MYLCLETKISTKFPQKIKKRKKKIVAKTPKNCPKNTCLLPPKIGLGMWKNGKRKPKWRIITIHHWANFLAKLFFLLHFFHFKNKINFFLEISTLSKNFTM